MLKKGGTSMAMLRCLGTGLVASLLILALASALTAGLEDQLAGYSDENAKGYLEPLVDAAGADLNMGLFESARIPTSGYYFRVDLILMAVRFSDDDRTYSAITEGDFSPRQRANAPTVVGPGDAVTVDGDAGSQFSFPGGFNLNSFALAAPQIRFGSFAGTEILLRGFGGVVGDNELGDIELMGFGVRHNIDQYFSQLPGNLAAGFMWQRFKAGTNEAGGDMFKTSAWTLGVQGSKIYGNNWFFFEPYGGLSLDSYNTDVSYYTEATTPASVLDLSYDPTYNLRITLGFLARFAYGGAKAEYSFGQRSGFSLGLTIGKF
jgi:hypothetical protein